ncbi:acyltransferase [Flavobacteriaceae bacterium F08102]|nr:acyltransferase [Flavobacteriaceae bacterium F08102]
MKKIAISLYNYFRAFYEYLMRSYLMYFPSHAVRKFFVRMQVAKFGNRTNILMGLELRNPKNISIGNNSVVNKKVLLDGRGGKLRIGNNVDIAQETNIWTLEHDVHDDHHKAVGGDVTIEDYVWIASRVTILPGVTIGKGAVVASNAVVTKDVAPMTIVGGIPAKPIGIRRSKLLYNLNYKPWFK